ncbi:hypothetical protein E2C01_001790 [Portunus trituberculatus]|uniref:Secreted protein n=1 Tax=Portunus trituberculatus TaxID=210409 RepID=A0A5B7CI57_PORTR|nr:hypothetical protein [Portunus trituberculatus]
MSKGRGKVVVVVVVLGSARLASHSTARIEADGSEAGLADMFLFSTGSQTQKCWQLRENIKPEERKVGVNVDEAWWSLCRSEGAAAGSLIQERSEANLMQPC